MIKLVYLIHAIYSPSGLERVLAQKANFLAATGRYDITIVTSRQKGMNPAFELHPSIKTVDIGANYYSFFGRIVYRRRLTRLLNKIHPDITDSTCCPRIPDVAKWRFPGKKIAEYHFSHHYLTTPDCKKDYARFFENNVRHFDKFIVLTKADAADWAPYTENVEQIYNPCMLKGEARLENKSVCLSGRLEIQKNIPDAIKAWKLVDERHPDWVLNIYGEGRLRRELQAQIDASGLKDKIILHGAVSDIHRRMRENSMMIMSSMYEGFPLSLIEGASLGLPLVSYDCKCGPGEIISDGVNGYLVPQGDYRMLADRICAIIEDEDLRKKMGKASVNVRELFDADEILKKWDDLLTSLAGI